MKGKKLDLICLSIGHGLFCLYISFSIYYLIFDVPGSIIVSIVSVLGVFLLVGCIYIYITSIQWVVKHD